MTLQYFFSVWLPGLGWGSLITLCAFVGRTLFRSGGIFSRAKALIDTVESTHELVQTATTNHLSHIESGVTQLAVTMEKGFDRLEKAIDRQGDRQADDAREIRQAIKNSK